MPGRFDQNSPHGLSRSSKEMPPTVPVLGLFYIHQPDVRLMHQGRGLQGLSRLLLRHFGGGQLAQFLIHQRQQLVGCVPVTVFDLRENPGHVPRRTRWCYRFEGRGGRGKFIASPVTL
jgi:hypothetical protein